MNNNRHSYTVVVAILGAALVAGINALGILRPEAASGFSDPIVFLIIIIIMASTMLITYSQLKTPSVTGVTQREKIQPVPLSTPNSITEWFFQHTKLRLGKKHPRYWFILAWWLFTLPDQFNVYQARFSKKTLWPAGIWLATTVISLPFFIFAFGLVIRSFFLEGLAGMCLIAALWYFIGSSGHNADQLDSRWWRANPNLCYIVFIALLFIALSISALLTIVGGLAGLYDNHSIIGDIAVSFMIGLGCSICFYVTPLESFVYFTSPSGIRISEIYFRGGSVLVGIWSSITALIACGILAGGLVGIMGLIIAFVSSAILEDNLERGKPSLLGWGVVAGFLISLLLVIGTYGLSA